ncbi:MAG: phospho-sugar mutase [Pirellulales bacterium]
MRTITGRSATRLRGAWDELEAAFWTVVPFGTAGRRGRMHPFGSAAINERTIGESCEALAEYLVELHGRGEVGALRCAVAYDTRHRSREFAELCAEIMAAAGFEVLFFDGHRATPELAFTVRDKQCACGIMISASHNPPSDNAIKVFWSTGGQLNAPHDAEVVRRIEQVGALRRISFAEALAAGRARYVHEEMDAKYRAAVLAQGHDGPRALKILYSPLHGVGATSVLPVLRAAGFHDVELYEPHAEPSGDFPNVPGHVANPENPAVFDGPIAQASKSDVALILASDPDADRIGCAARVTSDGPLQTLNGNQIGVLLADYVLQCRREAGRLTPQDFVVTTIVSSDMLGRIAASHGVRAATDLYTGFKWIGERIDAWGPDQFLFGFEEAHGYLAGSYIRDKDGAVAALLLAELAGRCRAEGRHAA